MGSFLITVAVFFGAIALFHLLFIWRRRSKLFWAYSDYFWLIVVSLSLIGATAEVRKAMVEWPLKIEEDRLVDDFVFAQEYAAGGQSYYCDMADDTDWPDEELHQQFLYGCDWFQGMVESLQSDVNSKDWEEFLERNEDVQDHPPQVIGYTTRAIRVLRRVQELRDSVQDKRKAAQTTDFELLIFAIWPWLLAFSLALRVTKVTAQVKDHT